MGGRSEVVVRSGLAEEEALGHVAAVGQQEFELALAVDVSISVDADELALQRWRGEQIAEEQFFYDPAQRVPRSP